MHNMSCCGVARSSNFDLDIDEVVRHHVEAKNMVADARKRRTLFAAMLSSRQ